MKLILFYDTETTGLPLFDAPVDDPRQPHIVQLAANLVDADTRKSVASFDLIAKPDGWEIPAEATAIHGISTEHAIAVGIRADVLVKLLLQLWRISDVRVGHNEGFDALLVRIALKRHGCSDELVEAFKLGAAECTCLSATAMCCLPGSSGDFKRPKLIEAFQHFFGKSFDGAHSARGDVDACMAVYWAIQDALSAAQSIPDVHAETTL
jgi:DNA polymerase III subunit epsilon